MSEKVTEDGTSKDEAEPKEEQSPDKSEAQAQAPGEAIEDEESGISIEVDTSEIEAEEKIAALKARLERVEKEKQDTFDRLLRTTADLDNFRKRSRRDIEDARLDARGAVLREMLPVVDNLERALQHAQGAGEDAAKSIRDGVELVLRQFVQAFERVDVTPFESVGQPFDPNLHEAVGQLETDEVPPGAVAQEMQKGYMSGQRLLRPALVLVAKAPPAETEQQGNGHDKGNGQAGPPEQAPQEPTEDSEES